MSTEIVSPQKQPYAVNVEAGKSYWWCACGRSQTQPFCDGTHRGSGITPVEYAAKATQTVYLCGCKHTKGQPLCDRTHRKI